MTLNFLKAGSKWVEGFNKMYAIRMYTVKYELVFYEAIKEYRA